ncbi:unnamed protein product [Larinioides sclopetarius]|uniref:Uncharacterized protein n=1 Tax=Larinioides sclopetarius TaxID=280406 RepID=A0AAV1Z029_9ARAC
MDVSEVALLLVRLTMRKLDNPDYHRRNFGLNFNHQTSVCFEARRKQLIHKIP